MHTSKFQLDPAWRMVVADLQLNVGPALARARLPTDLFERTDVRLSTDEYMRLWRAMEEVMGNPAFPLDLVPKLRHEGFDPALFSAFCSPDLNTALKRLARFKVLLCPMRLDVKETATTTSLEIVLLDTVSGDLPVCFVAAELVFFVHLARSCTGLPVRPVRVESPVALPSAKLFQAFFGVPVVVGDATRLVFDAADARQPFVSRNESMWAHFEPALQLRLDRLRAQASTADRVKACLLEQLPSGEAGMNDVAKRLLMSPRTLQRRLGDEGVSFQEVLRSVRAELSAHYLDNSDLSVTQIAFLLGFDDPSSFSRAYREWEGRTPEQARAAAAV